MEVPDSRRKRQVQAWQIPSDGTAMLRRSRLKPSGKVRLSMRVRAHCQAQAQPGQSHAPGPARKPPAGLAGRPGPC